MLLPIVMPPPETDERSRLLAVYEMRLRALERLYERRSAVQELIRTLEDYQRIGPSREVMRG